MSILLARADARALPLRDESVQCVVTSVPYFQLRKYECGAADHLQLGLEQTPQEFVEHLVEVFREVRRVLRRDGVCYANIGDSYAGGGRGPDGNTSLKGGRKHQRESRLAIAAMGGGRHVADGWKAGDLYGIPWLFAHAMRRDGWYVRSEIIWAKGRAFDEENGPGSCQPESATDRPSRSHEHVFLFTREREYFYDIEAAKEKSSSNSHARGKSGVNPRCADAGSGIKQNTSFSASVRDLVPTRNLRSVWSINTRPNPVGGHYAAFPESLVEPMVLVGTSLKGACRKCGTPWVRVLQNDAPPPSYSCTRLAVRERPAIAVWRPQVCRAEVGRLEVRASSTHRRVATHV